MNEARWLRRECVFAHVSLAVLLALGSFEAWRMHTRLEQLSDSTRAILAGQHRGSGADPEQERALLAKLERDNADWLYDANGNPTKEGEAIRHYTAKATLLGIDGVQPRWEYACAMVELDLLRDITEKNRQQGNGEQPESKSRNKAPPPP
jgi:hypothetical protein